MNRVVSTNENAYIVIVSCVISERGSREDLEMMVDAGLHENILKDNIHLLLEVVRARGCSTERRTEYCSQINGVHLVHVTVRSNSVGHSITTVQRNVTVTKLT